MKLIPLFAAALISFPTAAQPAFQTQRDCAKARDPGRCEARQTAKEACKEMRGAAKIQCMEDKMPPPDCSKARNAKNCAAAVAAREACKERSGSRQRQCLREQMKR